MTDAEKVIKAIKGQLEFLRIAGKINSYNAIVLSDALKLLKSQQAEIKQLAKTADGTWIQKVDATGHEYSMCSACKTVINTPDGCGGYYKLDMTGAKYCPNCGAKMD